MEKNNLLNQILKFVVVGGISFLIDFIVYTLVVKILTGQYSYLIAGVCGFVISIIFNYLASMAFVFKNEKGIDKKSEFLIFVVLSLIGMFLNTFLLWFYVDLITLNIQSIFNIHDGLYNWIKGINLNLFKDTIEFIKICAKIFSTAIVMVYNFVSRKMIFEKKK